MANSAVSFPSENLIIGGNFDTNPWQRGTTFAAAATATYSADRWLWTQVGAGVVTLQKTANAPTVAQANFFTQNCLEVLTTTADAAIAAGDLYAIGQRVEGYNFAQIAQRTFTISFWVRASVTGINCIYVRNSGVDRCYVSEYTINVANTWEYKTVTVTASPTAGTWDYTTGVGAEIGFCLIAGTNFHGTNNTWNAANNYCTVNQVNQMGTNANSFRVALVQVQGGSQANAFVPRTTQEELSLCQRYYAKSFAAGTAPAQAVGVNTGETLIAAVQAGATTERFLFPWPVRMRATPGTVVTYSPAVASAEARDETAAANCTGTTVADTSDRRVYINCTGAAGTAVANVIGLHWTASAEL